MYPWLFLYLKQFKTLWFVEKWTTRKTWTSFVWTCRLGKMRMQCLPIILLRSMLAVTQPRNIMVGRKNIYGVGQKYLKWYNITANKKVLEGQDFWGGSKTPLSPLIAGLVFRSFPLRNHHQQGPRHFRILSTIKHPKKSAWSQKWNLEHK